MNSLAKSGGIRSVRTVLQLIASYVTVETVEEGLRVVAEHFQFDESIKLLLVTVFAALYSYLHRTLLDPSSIPSLPDLKPTAGIPSEKL